MTDSILLTDGNHSNPTGVRATDSEIQKLYEEVLKSNPPNLRYVIFELGPINTQPTDVNLHTARFINHYTPADTLFLIQSLIEEELSLRKEIRYTGIHMMSLIEKELNMGMGTTIAEDVLIGDSLNVRRFGKSAGFQPLDIAKAASIQRRQRRFTQNPTQLTKRISESESSLQIGQQKVDHNAVRMENLSELLRISEEHGVYLIFILNPRLDGMYEELVPLYNRLPPGHRVEFAAPPRS